MKLKNGISYLEFTEQVKQCKADVYFDSKEGDYNLLQGFLCE